MMSRSQKIKLNDNEDKIVAFLDVLGFKKIISNKKETEKYFNEVISEIEILKTAKNGDQIRLQAVLISDSIVLSYPFEKKIENLKELIVAVAKIQSRLALQGIWLRGAITIGELEIQNFQGAQVVVGQGLVQAYEIETQLAIYPRVIFDARVFKILNTSRAELISKLKINSITLKEALYDPMGDDSREGFALNSLLISDAIWVNYLELIVLNKEKLKTFCEKLKSQMYESQTHFVKYKWVQSYLYALMHRNDVINFYGPEEFKKQLEIISNL